MKFPFGLAAAFSIAVASGQAPAQEPVPGGERLRSAETLRIAVLDVDLLFQQSRFGARAVQERSEALGALRRENGALDRQFAEEEVALASAKDELTGEEFELRAADFDSRASRRRTIQDGKAQLIDGWFGEQRRFFGAAVVELLNSSESQHGLHIILAPGQAVWHSESVELTRALLPVLDAVLGDGADIPNRRSALEHAGIDPEYSETGGAQ